MSPDRATGADVDQPPAPAEPAVSRRSGHGNLVLAVAGIVALIWVVLDQATKVLAVAVLEDAGRSIELGFMDLRVIRNAGGAFGFPGFPGLFVIVTTVVLVLVARALPQTDRLSLAVAYGMVTGGAAGNVLDRLFRDPGFPSGHVVDFLDLRWWPVFNIADIGIVTGALLIAFLLTQADRERQTAERQAAERQAAEREPSQRGPVRTDTAAPRQ